jgi:hypothetical protein
VAFQTAPGKHKGNDLPTNTLIPQQTIPALTLHLIHSKEQKGGDVIKRTTTGAITKTISLNKYKIQKPISKTTSKTNTLSPTEERKKKGWRLIMTETIAEPKNTALKTTRSS